MRRVRTFDFGERVQLALAKALLESNGIPCTTRNEHMLAASGGVPYSECYPELWVLDDAHFYSAGRILRDWQASLATDAGAWQCPRCEESCESQFSLCWNCGTPRES